VVGFGCAFIRRCLLAAYPVLVRQVSASACRGGGYAEFRLLLHVVVFERKARRYPALITVGWVASCVSVVRLGAGSGCVRSGWYGE